MNEQTISNSNPLKYFTIVALACIGLAGGYYAFLFTANNQNVKPSNIEGLLWPSKQLSAFELESTNGNGLNLEQLKGRWSFMFFGYTNCPDVCPMTLTTLAATVKQLQDVGASDATQVIFVSIDPKRDTIEQMKPYVKYFDTSFIGATGTIEKIGVLAEQLSVAHFRSEPDESGSYNVDHSSSIMLIDPQGRRVGIFGPQKKAENIATQFQAIRRYVESQS